MRHAESGNLNLQTLRRAALITGVAYLLNPVSYAEFSIMPRLFVPGAAQTVANLTAHPQLFVAAILSYFVSALGDIVIGWALFTLLAPISRTLALLGSVLQWVYAAFWLAAISNLGMLYRLISVPSYSGQVSPMLLPSLAVQAHAAFRSGWGLALILFGLHLVVTGWLIARSTYLPRWLGWLLILDGMAWVIDSLGVYLYPNAYSFWQIFFAGEIVFMIWLLGWGWQLRERKF